MSNPNVVLGRSSKKCTGTTNDSSIFKRYTCFVPVQVLELSVLHKGISVSPCVSLELLSSAYGSQMWFYGFSSYSNSWWTPRKDSGGTFGTCERAQDTERIEWFAQRGFADPAAEAQRTVSYDLSTGHFYLLEVFVHMFPCWLYKGTDHYWTYFAFPGGLNKWKEAKMKPTTGVQAVRNSRAAIFQVLLPVSLGFKT